MVGQSKLQRVSMCHWPGIEGHAKPEKGGWGLWILGMLPLRRFEFGVYWSSVVIGHLSTSSHVRLFVGNILIIPLFTGTCAFGDARLLCHSDKAHCLDGYAVSFISSSVVAITSFAAVMQQMI